MQDFLQSWFAPWVIILFDITALALIISINYRIFKRILDCLIATLGMILLSPMYAVILCIAFIEKKKGRISSVFCRTPYVGEKGKTVTLLTFALTDENGEMHGYGQRMQNSKLYALPKLIDVFLGKYSFIGVKALTESDCVFLTNAEEDRHNVKPGLINPLVLQGTDKTDYEDMLLSDLAYAEKCGIWLDSKIFFVWLVKKIRGEGDSYLGETRTQSYARMLLSEERITQADYDEAMCV